MYQSCQFSAQNPQIVFYLTQNKIQSLYSNSKIPGPQNLEVESKLKNA